MLRYASHKSCSLQAYLRFTGKSHVGRWHLGARRTSRIRKYNKDLIGRLTHINGKHDFYLRCDQVSSFLSSSTFFAFSPYGVYCWSLIETQRKKMEAKEQSSINNAYNKLFCACRIRRDTIMAKVGQREVICREYLEIHRKHDIIYLQCLKSHHAEVNFRKNLYTDSGSRYVSD